MSQKTNPIIFRLGIKNSWASKYLEKKPQESTIFSYNDLEIRKYIDLFFKKYGLKLLNCKLYYKKNALHLFLVYDIDFLKFKYLLLNNTKQQKISIKKFICNFISNFYKKIPSKSSIAFDLLQIRKRYKIGAINIKYFKKYLNYFKKLKLFVRKKNTSGKIIKNSSKFFIYLKKRFENFKNNNQKRLYYLNFNKLLKIQSKNLNQQTFINLFTKRLLTSISKFLQNKINVFLTLKITNNNNNHIENVLKKTITSNILNLKKFRNNNYFEQGINLMYNNSLKNKNQLSFLISEYISKELSRLKNPKFFNFFLKFLVNNVRYFLISNNKIKGVKIHIKGNLGRKPRAFSKVFITGKNVSKLKINNNLQYEESTCFSKKGTFGVKTWVTF